MAKKPNLKRNATPLLKDRVKPTAEPVAESSSSAAESEESEAVSWVKFEVKLECFFRAFVIKEIYPRCVGVEPDRGSGEWWI